MKQGIYDVINEMVLSFISKLLRDKIISVCCALLYDTTLIKINYIIL